MSTVIIAAIITGVAGIIAAILRPIVIHIYIDRQNRADLKRLTYGKEVAIRVSDGTYLKADANNDGTLVGGSKEINAWNIFTIVKADLSHNKPAKTIIDGDEIRFKVKLKGEWKYVSLRKSEQQPLKARLAEPGSWQTFTICTTTDNKPRVFHYDSTFALKAANGKMVTYNSRRDSGTNRLITIYDDHILRAETFVFVNPHAESNN